MNEPTPRKTEAGANGALLGSPPRRGGLLGAAERLHPGCFALVMATGIVAISCRLEDVPFAPAALGAFNWIAFCALAVLTLIRIARFPGRLMRDLSDPRSEEHTSELQSPL